MANVTLPPNGFEREFNRQILISERQRSLILMGVFGAMFAILLIYRGLALLNHEALPRSSVSVFIFAGAAVFEWWASRLIAQNLRTGRQSVPYRAYMSACIEVAIPTITMALADHHGHVVRSVTGPSSYTYFIFIILSSLRLDPRKSIFTGVVAALAYGSVVASLWGEISKEWVGAPGSLEMSFFMRFFLLLIAGGAAAFVSLRIHKALFETIRGAREREHIIGVFGQQVSPKVVNQLLSQPLGKKSEVREVCIMVLDIRNFTSFSQHRAPEEVVDFLNTLWGFMVRTVNEHDGLLNRFLGDGFLAVFGAPISNGRDCQDAVAATRKILSELKRMEESGALPPTKIGVALHYGEAIIGNVGCEEHKEYTVIGDVVNVAFRIEALNKEFGSTVLISEPVRKAADVSDAQPIAPIPIRGREEPVMLYRLE